MPLVLPYWVVQRQAKAEPAGTDLYRVTAPNQPEVFLGVRRRDSGRWEGYLRRTADGPDEAVSEKDFEQPEEAWGSAFELYRVLVVT
jgi:hypothetical protein